MATHTWTSNEARDKVIEMNSGMTEEEFLSIPAPWNQYGEGNLINDRGYEYELEYTYEHECEYDYE